MIFFHHTHTHYDKYTNINEYIRINLLPNEQRWFKILSMCLGRELYVTRTSIKLNSFVVVRE